MTKKLLFQYLINLSNFTGYNVKAEFLIRNVKQMDNFFSKFFIYTFKQQKNVFFGRTILVNEDTTLCGKPLKNFSPKEVITNLI